MAGIRTLGAANRNPPVGAAIIGYMVYQDQQSSGVEIKIGEGGISIQEN